MSSLNKEIKSVKSKIRSSVKYQKELVGSLMDFIKCDSIKIKYINYPLSFEYEFGSAKLLLTFNIAKRNNKLSLLKKVSYKSKLNSSIEEELNALMFVNNKLENINSSEESKTFILNIINEFYKSKKEVNKLKNKIELLNTKLIIEKNKIFIDPVMTFAPKINDFCIDKFLCDHFEIKYDKKPKKEDLEKLTKHVIDNINEIQEEALWFYTWITDTNGFYFQEVPLYISLKDCDSISLSLETQQSIETTTKSINKFLLNQFSYKNEFVTQYNVCSIETLSNFIGRGFVPYKDTPVVFKEEILVNKIKNF
jgi:hypothetical protein